MNLLCEDDAKAVREIVAKQLSVEETQLIPEARIEADLGADSLDVMEIILAVEERFAVSIPDEIAERVTTVGDLMEELGELLQVHRSRRP